MGPIGCCLLASKIVRALKCVKRVPERGAEICRLGEMIKTATSATWEQHPANHPLIDYPGCGIAPSSSAGRLRPGRGPTRGARRTGLGQRGDVDRHD